MPRKLQFIPYPSIGRHGVVGDRRTACLIAADGTVDWLCLPNYDGEALFGALIDVTCGGFFRVGPSAPFTGEQSYLDHTPVVVTTWQSADGALELRDVMIDPRDERPEAEKQRRVLVRHLCCTRGKQHCVIHLAPRENFGDGAKLHAGHGGATFAFGQGSTTLWASVAMSIEHDAVVGEFDLRAGDEAWVVLAFDDASGAWSVERARQAFDQTVRDWHEWLGEVRYAGPRKDRLLHSGLILHLLGYAPCGSMVAAPTTSLPERIGGPLNWDYRYAWIRDGSLAVAGLSLLGAHQTASRYLAWLAGLTSTDSMPLQVAYHIDGSPHLAEHLRHDLDGYRDSRPVRFGNRAFNQIQTGSLGYLADCTLIHLEQGGSLTDDVWKMTRRIADWVAAHWQEQDSGIWELPRTAHYTSSRVMGWVTLDRACEIAERAGHREQVAHWRQEADAIHADVLAHGWSEREQTFVQRYDAEALDASALLIPVMGFLPADDPRVRKTRDRIAEELSIDGLIYRFDPMTTPVENPKPMGQFEASFLPCTFWLASAYALAGMNERAEDVLRHAEALETSLGLFSEEADPRDHSLMGNYPLLFSQVEYLRAALLVARAHGQSHNHDHHNQHQSAHHTRAAASDQAGEQGEQGERAHDGRTASPAGNR